MSDPHPLPVSIPLDLRDSFSALSEGPVYYICDIYKTTKKNKEVPRVVIITAVSLFVCARDGRISRHCFLSDIAEVATSLAARALVRQTNERALASSILLRFPSDSLRDSFVSTLARLHKQIPSPFVSKLILGNIFDPASRNVFNELIRGDDAPALDPPLWVSQLAPSLWEAESIDEAAQLILALPGAVAVGSARTTGGRWGADAVAAAEQHAAAAVARASAAIRAASEAVRQHHIDVVNTSAGCPDEADAAPAVAVPPLATSRSPRGSPSHPSAPHTSRSAAGTASGLSSARIKELACLAAYGLPTLSPRPPAVGTTISPNSFVVASDAGPLSARSEPYALTVRSEGGPATARSAASRASPSLTASARAHCNPCDFSTGMDPCAPSEGGSGPDVVADRGDGDDLPTAPVAVDDHIPVSGRPSPGSARSASVPPSVRTMIAEQGAAIDALRSALVAADERRSAADERASAALGRLHVMVALCEQQAAQVASLEARLQTAYVRKTRLGGKGSRRTPTDDASSDSATIAAAVAASEVVTLRLANTALTSQIERLTSQVDALTEAAALRTETEAAAAAAPAAAIAASAAADHRLLSGGTSGAHPTPTCAAVAGTRDWQDAVRDAGPVDTGVPCGVGPAATAALLRIVGAATANAAAAAPANRGGGHSGANPSVASAAADASLHATAALSDAMASLSALPTDPVAAGHDVAAILRAVSDIAQVMGGPDTLLHVTGALVLALAKCAADGASTRERSVGSPAPLPFASTSPQLRAAPARKPTAPNHREVGGGGGWESVAAKRAGVPAGSKQAPIPTVSAGRPRGAAPWAARPGGAFAARQRASTRQTPMVPPLHTAAISPSTDAVGTAWALRVSGVGAPATPQLRRGAGSPVNDTHVGSPPLVSPSPRGDATLGIGGVIADYDDDDDGNDADQWHPPAGAPSLAADWASVLTMCDDAKDAVLRGRFL